MQNPETCGGYHVCACGNKYECSQRHICQMPYRLDGCCARCWEGQKFRLGWNSKKE